MLPLLAKLTAWHRRDMLLISLRMVSWGMTLHSSNNASSNSWSVWGWCCRLWRHLPIKSQRCSIQFRSELSLTWNLNQFRVQRGKCGFEPFLQHISRLLSPPDENEVSLVVQGNSPPNHQWSSAICNSLQQVRRQILFSSMPPHPDTTICPRKQESLFIRKHYWGPI